MEARGVRSPETRVTCGCESAFEGSKELNLGPLQEQEVFLPTEPSLQPQIVVLKGTAD